MRFILCNLFYPQIEHTFDSVNRHIPPIDHPPGLLAGIDKPLFYKTHGMTHATNIIFLHRHVGGALESEYWYKKKFGENVTLEKFLTNCDFGAGWRDMVDFYFPARVNIPYECMGDVETYLPFTQELRRQTMILQAIRKSAFDRMQAIEAESGLGDYPDGDKNIKFCRKGVVGQWKEWPTELKSILLEKNAVQLKKLGYA